MSEKEIKFWFKLIASLVITTELYAYMIKQRGYLNPGGELFVVPLIFLVKYLYREFRPELVELFRIIKMFFVKEDN